VSRGGACGSGGFVLGFGFMVRQAHHQRVGAHDERDGVVSWIPGCAENDANMGGDGFGFGFMVRQAHHERLLA